jgi:hypothetical protein
MIDSALQEQERAEVQKPSRDFARFTIRDEFANQIVLQYGPSSLVWSTLAC